MELFLVGLGMTLISERMLQIHVKKLIFSVKCSTGDKGNIRVSHLIAYQTKKEKKLKNLCRPAFATKIIPKIRIATFSLSID